MWSKGLHDGNDFGVHSRHTVRGRDGDGGVRDDDWSEEEMTVCDECGKPTTAGKRREVDEGIFLCRKCYQDMKDFEELIGIPLMKYAPQIEALGKAFHEAVRKEIDEVSTPPTAPTPRP